MSGIHDGVLFLIKTFFDLYLFILVIRVLLAFAGASYFDPITQFVVKCSDFLVKPVRRVIPNISGIEVSTVVIIFALEFVKFALIAALTDSLYSIAGIAVIALADTIGKFLLAQFYAIIMQVILSWVQPGSPMNSILYRINAPIMRPIQRLVPTIGGIDISPIPAMILLQLLIILIVNPLMGIGLGANLG